MKPGPGSAREVEVLWAEEALLYVTEAPKKCDMEYSVSEWLSDLRRHKNLT